ncbi:hypothetical protein KPL35_15840 [Clostridium sp. CF011]|uniref:hypothetical protein n=1 Tax=Clostridium sp. CF011 TaxID=2843318 RepID=UPI001C0B482E|nr:hypothetical protein [Clostridium sp. CF011]
MLSVKENRDYSVAILIGIVLNKASKKELPPLVYDLTGIQRDANRKFGFSAKPTHKIPSYPRTGSRHITTDIVATLLDRLKSIAIGPYEKAARSIVKGRIHTRVVLIIPPKRYIRGKIYY